MPTRRSTRPRSSLGGPRWTITSIWLVQRRHERSRRLRLDSIQPGTRFADAGARGRQARRRPGTSGLPKPPAGWGIDIYAAESSRRWATSTDAAARGDAFGRALSVFREVMMKWRKGGSAASGTPSTTTRNAATDHRAPRRASASGPRPAPLDWTSCSASARISPSSATMPARFAEVGDRQAADQRCRRSAPAAADLDERRRRGRRDALPAGPPEDAGRAERPALAGPRRPRELSSVWVAVAGQVLSGAATTAATASSTVPSRAAVPRAADDRPNVAVGLVEVDDHRGVVVALAFAGAGGRSRPPARGPRPGRRRARGRCACRGPGGSPVVPARPLVASAGTTSWRPRAISR